MFYTTESVESAFVHGAESYLTQFMSESNSPSSNQESVADFRSRFAYTKLGEVYNKMLWDYLEYYLQEDQHILELECKSGIDTLHFAEHGIKVTATDSNENALNQVQYKSGRRALREHILPIHLDGNSLPSAHEFLLDLRVLREYWPRKMDAVYCGYGVINQIKGLRNLAQFLWKVLEKDAFLITVVKNKFCLREAFTKLKNKDFKTLGERARLQDSSDDATENETLWYPSPSELAEHLQPEFELVATRALGFAIPSSATAFDENQNQISDALINLEKKHSTKKWASLISDYNLMVFKRKQFQRSAG